MMFAPQPKKLLIMNILDILKRYSDADHRLSQRDIIDVLHDEYDMEADRKAVKRNLMNLLDFGYHLEYSESFRRNKKGEEEVIYTDWYLEREFSDAELRLLIDSLLFSKHIPYSQCKDLIEKIKGLSNRYFEAKVHHICNLPENQPKNAELFYTIEVLDDAIEKGSQVTFNYADYGTDKKLHLRKDGDGKNRNYLVNPYQMVATNGRYYLIGNYDRYNDVSHYRIDRIRDIHLLETKSKPQRDVKDLEHGLNLPAHMAEHIYMFSGESALVTFRIKKYIVNDVIDWFGNDISFFDEDEEEVTAKATVNLMAMRHWGVQYAVHARVLSPQCLVEQIKNDLAEAKKNYEEQSK